VGPRAGLDKVVKRKIPSPRRDSNPDRPARSQSPILIFDILIYLPSGPFPEGSSIQILYALLISPFGLHVQPIVSSRPDVTLLFLPFAFLVTSLLEPDAEVWLLHVPAASSPVLTV
jgi:hypothetical protein